MDHTTKNNIGVKLKKPAKVAGCKPAGPPNRNLAGMPNHNGADWQAASTLNYRLLSNLLTEAQNYGEAYAFCAPAGTGKTFTVKKYAAAHAYVGVVDCEEHLTKRDFLLCFSRALGLNTDALRTAEILDAIEKGILSMQRPLIVLDEFDKVKDDILCFFITLYNRLNDKCGLVICSIDYLEKRVIKGVRLRKKGYQEFFSRLGRRFIKATVLSGTDVIAICKANGISTAADIETIVKDCDGDGRRIYRKANALKRSKKSRDKNQEAREKNQE